MLFTLLLTASADDALYDPAPPPGSGFVRVIQASDASATPRIADRELDPLTCAQVSPYVPVAQGSAQVALGDASVELQVSAGGYYSVAGGKEGLVVIEDDALSHVGKALVALYHLGSAGAASLVTVEGAQAVVADVASGGVGSREVNAVAVDLAVQADGAEVGKLEGLQLQRGAAYSALHTDCPGQAAAWVQNTTSTR